MKNGGCGGSRKDAKSQRGKGRGERTEKWGDKKRLKMGGEIWGSGSGSGAIFGHFWQVGRTGAEVGQAALWPVSDRATAPNEWLPAGSGDPRRTVALFFCHSIFLSFPPARSARTPFSWVTCPSEDVE